MASLLYLGLGLFLLLCTLGIHFPRVYGRSLSPIGALFSMILALQVPQFIGVGFVVTVVVALLGGLRGPIGQLGLLLHGVSWALLFTYLWRMHSGLPILDGTPVSDGDQPFGQGLTEEEMRQLPPGQISWRPSLTYRIPAMLLVQVESGVVYREVEGVRLRVDIYRPRDATGPLPAALYIHGGGWIVGNRRQSRFMMYELAAAGWVVFAISYRLAPRFPLPAAVIDCKAALAWIREHGGRHGADPRRVVVLGGSAGGHLASMVALTPGDPRFQPGFEQADTSVLGAVVFYGVSDFVTVLEGATHRGTVLFFERVVFKTRYRDNPETFRLAQPTSYLSDRSPPVLLVHGTNDGLVPIAESRRLYEGLKKAGARSIHLLEVPGALHAFEITPTPLHQRTIRIILRFMAALRKAGPA